jgi:hypothetical protein
MRWPFHGSRIEDYLSVFRACLELPPDEVDAVTTEVHAHLEETADSIGGDRGKAEIQATLGLGSPRDLAARIGLARRPWRPRRALVLGPSQDQLRYEVPAGPVRTYRRTVGTALLFFPFSLAIYWAEMIAGPGALHYLLAFGAVAVPLGLAGRWLLPRLSETETLHLSVWYLLSSIALASVTAALHFAHVVQGDAILWVGPLCVAALLLGALIYRLRNPNSRLVVGPRRSRSMGA